MLHIGRRCCSAARGSWPQQARRNQVMGLPLVASHHRRSSGARHGFMDRHNVAIEYRWRSGRLRDQLQVLAADLVRRQVGRDCRNRPPRLSSRGQSSNWTIPIVFDHAGDLPVRSFSPSLNGGHDRDQLVQCPESAAEASGAAVS